MGFSFYMAKENNLLDPESIIPRLKNAGQFLKPLFSTKKRIVATVLILLLIGFFGFRMIGKKDSQTASVKSVTQQVNKSYDFTALDNQGKPLPGSAKIKLTLTSVEKTNQVLVKDQIFVAKNNKAFLIVHLTLKNDATTPENIIPGDLVRLIVNGDDENKFAPDLHNNLVFVAAISTKEDRVGFVIPNDAKNFTFNIGELTGKKDEISVKIPS